MCFKNKELQDVQRIISCWFFISFIVFFVLLQLIIVAIIKYRLHVTLWWIITY